MEQIRRLCRRAQMLVHVTSKERWLVPSETQCGKKCIQWMNHKLYRNIDLVHLINPFLIEFIKLGEYGLLCNSLKKKKKNRMMIALG